MKPTQAASNAIEMFNAISREHDLQVDRFLSRGMTGREAQIASYMALRALLTHFAHVPLEVSEVLPAHEVARIVELMSQGRRSSRPEVTA